MTTADDGAGADSRLPRSYLIWLGGAVVSQAGDAALYFALGWAASASASGGPVLSAITCRARSFPWPAARWATGSARGGS
jgi:hypothetical protein